MAALICAEGQFSPPLTQDCGKWKDSFAFSHSAALSIETILADYEDLVTSMEASNNSHEVKLLKLFRKQVPEK